MSSSLARRPDAADRPPPKALVAVLPGRGAIHGALDVYRDGEAYVVVGRVGGVRKAIEGPGNVEVGADVYARFPTEAALRAEQRREMLKDPERYARLVGAFGIDDMVDRAPELPEHLKEAIDGRRGLSLAAVGEAVRALPSGEPEAKVALDEGGEMDGYDGPRVATVDAEDYEVDP